MQHLRNQMRAEAQGNGVARSNARMGTVSAYDPGAYAVKVLIQPEGTETGWMPIGTAWMGNGWGIVCPPSIGDQVEILPMEGTPEAWVMGQRFFSDEQRPPESVKSGVFLLKHQSGSLLRFANDGSVQLVTASDLTATVGGNLTAMIEGTTMVTSVGTATLTAPTLDIVANVNVTGDVMITGATEFIGPVTDNGHNIGSTHTHTMVKSGSDISGPPP